MFLARALAYLAKIGYSGVFSTYYSHKISIWDILIAITAVVVNLENEILAADQVLAAVIAADFALNHSCTRLLALVVERNVKCRLSLPATDQCIAITALKKATTKVVNLAAATISANVHSAMTSVCSVSHQLRFKVRMMDFAHKLNH